MMPLILILGIIISEGYAWLYESFTNKNFALGFSVLCILPGVFGMGKNFVPNNESTNYIAYDFNKLTLESMPPNGYLISDGRDNMTFPLYYLREVENIRPDIHLEIYYSTSPVDEVFLQSRVAENGGLPVFIDLLPQNYASMAIKPYNFIYEYGDDPSIPPSTLQNPVMRGIRQNLDFPNMRLAMLYYIKTAIIEKDPVKKQAAVNALINAPGDNAYYLNILGDYAYTVGDFDTAKKVYEKSNNAYGLQKIDDKVNNPDHVEDWNVQNGMS